VVDEVESAPASSVGGEPVLRIALVAPPWFEIPPAAYGGIEWVVYGLARELCTRGHDVTLVAAGRNHTQARFVQTFADPPSLRIGESGPEVLHAARTQHALNQEEFDVVHDHSFAGPLLAAARRAPTVVTVHGPVGGELGDYYRALARHIHLVAISAAQRRQAPDLPWIGTVHNGVPVAEYPLVDRKEDFVLFLGRMGPEKGAHLAIDAAREAGYHLILAGKCTEPVELAYFEREIEPRLGPRVDWIGQVAVARKKDLLSKARCLLFPIQWQEPFGIVMVEALACGTPVVALNYGSVPEVVENGVSGFVCEDMQGLVKGIGGAHLIDPQACRERAMRRFDVAVMVDGYEVAYREAIHPSADTAASAEPLGCLSGQQ
jgi:glycosyltransferase involved in cell wall biosynthesis